jgi:hypothetical protein
MVRGAYGRAALAGVLSNYGKSADCTHVTLQSIILEATIRSEALPVSTPLVD